jgi:hypothetical protein
VRLSKIGTKVRNLEFAGIIGNIEATVTEVVAEFGPCADFYRNLASPGAFRQPRTDVRHWI